HGVLPACRTLDCVSVFALTVEDAQTIAGILEGHDPADCYSRSAPLPARFPGDRPWLGIPRELPWFGDSHAQAAWEASLENIRRMGVELLELDFTPMRELAELLYGGPWVAERYAAIATFYAQHAVAMNSVVRDRLSRTREFSAGARLSPDYRPAELTAHNRSEMAPVDALL